MESCDTTEIGYIKKYVERIFNLFHATGLFLYSLKASLNLCFFMFSGGKEDGQ